MNNNELTKKQERRIKLILECLHCIKGKDCPYKEVDRDSCVSFEEREQYKNGNI